MNPSAANFCENFSQRPLLSLKSPSATKYQGSLILHLRKEREKRNQDEVTMVKQMNKGLSIAALLLLLLMMKPSTSNAEENTASDVEKRRELHEYNIHNHHLYLAPGVVPYPYENCIPDHEHFGGTEDHHLNGALTAGHIHHAPLKEGKKMGKKGKSYGNGKASSSGKGGKSKGGKSYSSSKSYGQRNLHVRRRMHHRYRSGAGYRGGNAPNTQENAPHNKGGNKEGKQAGKKNTGLFLPLCPPGFTDFPTESPTAFFPPRPGTRRPIGPVPTLSPDMRLPTAPESPTMAPSSGGGETTFAPSAAAVPGATAAPSAAAVPGATAAPSAAAVPGATVAPTSTVATTAAPTGAEATGAPTAPGATAAPTTPAADTIPGQPPNTQRVLVESFLQFGFFDEEGVVVREPTQEEIDGLLAQTSSYYKTTLRTTYPDIAGFQATFVTSMFDETAEFPVRIEFDANAFFPEASATIPTAGQVFSSMEMGDYDDYITNYVWMSEPMDGLFANTQRTAYNARVQPAA